MLLILTDVINDACGSDPCQHGGTCTTVDTWDYFCTCPEGVTGNDCETNNNSPYQNTTGVVELKLFMLQCVFIAGI